MVRQLILSIAILCGATSLSAQDNVQPADTARVHLKGRVTDEKQDPIALCQIRVEGQAVGVTASLDGRYNLSFSRSDSVVIVYSMIGYETRRRVLKKPQGNLTLNIVMRERAGEMTEVTVSDARRQMDAMQQLNKEELKRLPSTSGNAVEELVATQAGVSTHNELSSQYNVRGGSFDENCVYINGVEVYRPMLVNSGQQEGLSIINSDMVDKINFSAGGFAAKYADRMSSVLDITYAHPKRTEASISASLLGANVYVGHGKKNFSFSNGLRYKTNQYMLGSLETKGEYSPNFLDYQAYMHWTPTNRWTFDAIVYINRNNYNFKPTDRETNFGTNTDAKQFKVYFDGKEEDQFQTLFGTVRAARRLGKAGSLRLTASAFDNREKETYDIQGQYWLNETNGDAQLGVGSYMEYARNFLYTTTQAAKLDYELRTGRHFLETGIGWKHEKVRENSNEWEYRDSSGYSIPHTGSDLQVIYNMRANTSISSSHLELYAQDTYRRESSVGILSLNYGLRLSYWDWNQEWLISPRASIGFVPASNDNFTFRLAMGLYNQRPFYKELRDTVTIGGNTSVQLNRDIKSQRSFQVVAGMEYKFRAAQRLFRFTTELYYKAQWKMNPYNVNNLKIVYYGNNCATGSVYGADFKLYGEFVPGTDSWISLGLMKASIEMDGKSFPQPTDQRYNINLFFSDYFPGTTRWKMNLKAHIAGGLPFGTPHSGLERNVFRAPSYRRFDMGMNYRLIDNTDQHLSRFRYLRNIWLGLDCFNVFGINNVSSYYWVTDISNHQYAVPNYLTGRMVNARILVEL